MRKAGGSNITTITIAHLVGSALPQFLFTSTDSNSYSDIRVAEDVPTGKDGRLPLPSALGLGTHVAVGEFPFLLDNKKEGGVESKWSNPLENELEDRILR